MILKMILILVPSFQNLLVNFWNLFSVNLENFSLKGNLKIGYFLQSYMIFLFKYLLTYLSINLGGCSFFCKMTFSFSRSKWKPSHLLFKQKVWSIKVLMRPFLYVNGTKLLYFCQNGLWMYFFYRDW